MSIVAIVGAKHSPGATTLAVALASAAPADQAALVVEADPAGGDIAARARMSLDPGLLTLAAAGRRGVTDQLLDGHSQLLESGAAVLVGPSSPDQAATALAGVTGSLVEVLTRRSGVAFVDAGRWDPRSPVNDLLGAAAAIVVVFRPTLEGFEHARMRIAALCAFDVGIIAAPVGERPYAAVEIAAALNGMEVNVIAHDPRAATAIASGARSDRWLRRSPLLRSIAPLAERLCASEVYGVAAR